MAIVNHKFTNCNSKYQYHNRLIYGHDTQDNNPNAVNTAMMVRMIQELFSPIQFSSFLFS